MPHSAAKNREVLDAEAETIRLFQQGMTTHQIADRLGVQPPTIRRRLLKRGLWKINTRDAINGSKSGQTKKKRAAEIREETANDAAAYTRVDRTPCSFCGVRADIGCRHQRIWA
jgi:uncharacterized protein YjcR